MQGRSLDEPLFACPTDIDECSRPVPPCKSKCFNTEGSYVCSCNTGYTLAEDKVSCKGVTAHVLICNTYTISSLIWVRTSGKERELYACCMFYGTIYVIIYVSFGNTLRLLHDARHLTNVSGRTCFCVLVQPYQIPIESGNLSQFVADGWQNSVAKKREERYANITLKNRHKHTKTIIGNKCTRKKIQVVLPVQ